MEPNDGFRDGKRVLVRTLSGICLFFLSAAFFGVYSVRADLPVFVGAMLTLA